MLYPVNAESLRRKSDRHLNVRQMHGAACPVPLRTMTRGPITHACEAWTREPEQIFDGGQTQRGPVAAGFGVAPGAARCRQAGCWDDANLWRRACWVRKEPRGLNPFQALRSCAPHFISPQNGVLRKILLSLNMRHARQLLGYKVVEQRTGGAQTSHH
jgi:hypothetical protein